MGTKIHTIFHGVARIAGKALRRKAVGDRGQSGRLRAARGFGRRRLTPDRFRRQQVSKVLGLVAGYVTSGLVGVTENSLLQTVGDEVEIAGGSSLTVGSRLTSSISCCSRIQL